MKPFAKPLATLAVFVLFTCACSMMKEIQKGVEKAQEPKAFNSTDGSCQINGPASWSPEPGLNDKAVIELANKREEQYLIVLPESKMDFGKTFNLDQYAAAIVATYKDTSNSEMPIMNATFTPISPVMINGMQARRFEIAGTANNIKANFIITLVDGKKNFYQIMSWTLASKYAANKPVLIQASDTLKESDGSAPPPTPKR